MCLLIKKCACCPSQHTNKLHQPTHTLTHTAHIHTHIHAHKQADSKEKCSKKSSHSTKKIPAPLDTHTHPLTALKSQPTTTHSGEELRAATHILAGDTIYRYLK